MKKNTCDRCQEILDPDWDGPIEGLCEECTADSCEKCGEPLDCCVCENEEEDEQ